MPTAPDGFHGFRDERNRSYARDVKRSIPFPFVLALFISCAFVTAQQQTQPTTSTSDEAGFDPIFDGKTLAGWEGDPKYWRVEDGALVGEITPGNEIRQNTFIIWRGGVTKDFEL